MFMVHVLYPSGSDFKTAYYLNSHMTMVDRLWKPFGLQQAFVAQTESAGGGEGRYQVITTLVFGSREGFSEALKATADEVLGDIANFSAVTPEILIGESL